MLQSCWFVEVTGEMSFYFSLFLYFYMLVFQPPPPHHLFIVAVHFCEAQESLRLSLHILNYPWKHIVGAHGKQPP